jgi:TatD DNase family protein
MKLDPAYIFDTHTHLMDPKFSGETEDIIADLRAHHVQGFTEIGFDLASSREAVRLAEHYAALRQQAVDLHVENVDKMPEVYAAAGFHPEHADQVNASALAEIRRLAASPRVVAIGEIGLDYHFTRDAYRKAAELAGREPDPEDLASADPEPDIQRDSFRQMLRLARELGKPVNIHSRDAAQDTYDILVAEQGYENSGILHCFGYSVEMADRFVKLGMYLGIGGVVTFKNARKLKEVVEKIPLEHLVLETDAPYMAPTPYRGTRNDPRNLPYIAAAVAEIKKMHPEDVIRITTENAARVYRIG